MLKKIASSSVSSFENCLNVNDSSNVMHDNNKKEIQKTFAGSQKNANKSASVILSAKNIRIGENPIIRESGEYEKKTIGNNIFIRVNFMDAKIMSSIKKTMKEHNAKGLRIKKGTMLFLKSSSFAYEEDSLFFPTYSTSVKMYEFKTKDRLSEKGSNLYLDPRRFPDGILFQIVK